MLSMVEPIWGVQIDLNLFEASEIVVQLGGVVDD